MCNIGCYKWYARLSSGRGPRQPLCICGTPTIPQMILACVVLACCYLKKIGRGKKQSQSKTEHVGTNCAARETFTTPCAGHRRHPHHPCWTPHCGAILRIRKTRGDDNVPYRRSVSTPVGGNIPFCNGQSFSCKVAYLFFGVPLATSPNVSHQDAHRMITLIQRLQNL